MKASLFRPFTNLSIRYKLFATYVLIISIPFLLLLAINVNMATMDSEKESLFTVRKVLEESNSYLQYKAQTITEVLNFIASNDVVQSLVGADSVPYKDVNLWGYDAYRLAKVIKQNYNPDIESIQLYMTQGLAEETESADYRYLGNVEHTEWFQQFQASPYSLAWLPSSVLDGEKGNDSITVLRKIPNPHSMLQFEGIVRSQISQKSLSSVLSHASLTPSAAAVLYNDRGDLLSSSPNLKLKPSELQTILREHLEQNQTEDYWDDNITLNGNRLLLGVQSIPGTDTKIALIVPYSDILNTTIKSRNRLISLFLIIVPFTLPLSFFVAGSATKRLRLLSLHVRKIKNGNFDVPHLQANQDEIGELMHTINQMVHNMSELMGETYKLGRDVKNKELKALQAQINPHFLYNSLDLINSMAIESGATEISTVVGELAVFYKLSLSNGQEIVTLKSELKHIEAYVRIQNMRFGSAISLQIEVPDELQEVQVPKIMLQPLIENCILHGILEKNSEQGIIHLNAWSDDEDLYIQVKDDGVGMSEEELAAVLNGNGSKKTGGFGVWNIRERIRLFYGNKYGLQYKSAPGQGTSVILRIPGQPYKQP